MIDLEERIAQMLHERAPVFLTPMPRGTATRVRLRQAVTSVAAVTVVIGFVVLAMSAVSALPVAQPAGRQTVPAPSGVLPDLQGEHGGVNDGTAAPVSTETEDTTAHGTTSTEPYTEQVQGQEALSPHAEARGRVRARQRDRMEPGRLRHPRLRGRGVPRVPRGVVRRSDGG